MYLLAYDVLDTYSGTTNSCDSANLPEQFNSTACSGLISVQCAQRALLADEVNRQSVPFVSASEYTWGTGDRGLML